MRIVEKVTLDHRLSKSEETEAKSMETNKREEVRGVGMKECEGMFF